jgi:uncharacterized protein YjlB
MRIPESVMKTIETLTGYGRPSRRAVRALLRVRKPQRLHFADDGRTPNNRLPLLLYRAPVRLALEFDPAAIFEELFAANGWTDSWRDSIYTYRHYHAKTHEVLGIARGSVRVELGGAKGRVIELKAGDVIVHPAGVSHKRIGASSDLLVVGAYPQAGEYDEYRPSKKDHDRAVLTIPKVRVPPKDPVYGRDGPLPRLWRKSS